MLYLAFGLKFNGDYVGRQFLLMDTKLYLEFFLLYSIKIL